MKNALRISLLLIALLFLLAWRFAPDKPKRKKTALSSRAFPRCTAARSRR